MLPPLDRAELVRLSQGGQALRYRCFWLVEETPGPLSDACLSQWWPCRFAVDGETYSSAEQFMMASKARFFGDRERQVAIMATSSPAEIKALGRKVHPFDGEAWSRVRADLVTVGSVAKFEQTPALRDYLLGTGDDVLVEASPTDLVWGIGLAADDPKVARPESWPGLNLLGFSLMRARAVLRGQLPVPQMRFATSE